MRRNRHDDAYRGDRAFHRTLLRYSPPVLPNDHLPSHERMDHAAERVRLVHRLRSETKGERSRVADVRPFDPGALEVAGTGDHAVARGRGEPRIDVELDLRSATRTHRGQSRRRHIRWLVGHGPEVPRSEEHTSELQSH